MPSRLVFSCGPAGIEYVAPTYRQYVEGAKLAPRPEVEVTTDDVRPARMEGERAFKK